MDERLRHRNEEIEQISEEKKVLVKQMKDAMQTSEHLDMKVKGMVDK